MYTPRNVHTTQVDANLNPLELLSLSPQASSYRDIGKVTGNGLIKGHAYAITDTDKASITQRRHSRLCSAELLSLSLVACFCRSSVPFLFSFLQGLVCDIISFNYFISSQHSQVKSNGIKLILPIRIPCHCM